ncbi:MAG: tripartite tricarboxylate transporter substrate binding protein [Burkholderiales bacterium]|nr:tripartite tricarboxylate transporter substrate binding protein [Burkholderiales bacterium]
MTAVTAASAFAQAYPAKPIKLINNIPAGGPSDFLARTVGEHITATSKQPVVTDNRAGAGGNVGADAVAKSAADGYTVLFGIDTTLTVNPHLYSAMPFKADDLEPVIVMASSGLLVGVHPGTGFKTLKELVSAAPKRPLSFSSGGSGSPGHLAVALLNDAIGASVQHVPYKGNTPAVTAVLSGEVEGGILATPGMLPHVKSGKITPLAVTSRQRSRGAPDVPTVSELGFNDLRFEVLYVASVPKGTPAAVVQYLQKAIAEALNRPQAQAQLATMELFYEGATGPDASKRLADNSTRYAPVIKKTGMKVD